MAIPAMWGGRCACGAAVAAGELITYARGAGIIGCPACGQGRGQGAPGAAPAPVAAPPAAPADLEIDATEAEPTPEPLTISISDEQRAVVAWREGEALVAASAGSGKSTTLAERIGAIVAEGTPIGSCLLLAFNRAAAIDLRAKVRRRTGCSERAASLAVSTFHAYAWRVLRGWREAAGEAIPALLDSDDDDAPKSLPLARSAARAVRVDLEIEELIGADLRIREAYLGEIPNGETIAEELGVDDSHGEAVARFARAYGQERQRANAVDFGDILVSVARECEQRTARALALRGTVAHLSIDEAQDGNRARWAIVDLLAEGATSLISVGDLRQSIAGFAGAKPSLFRARLDKGAKLLTILTNRRSGSAIVATGNRIAAGADWNLGGDCAADPVRGRGTVIALPELSGAATEARWIVDDIRARIAAGAAITEHAILVRTRAAAVAIVAACVAGNLPARVRGLRGGLWGGATGQDVLAYLRAAEGDYRALRRAANKPLRYVRGDDVERAAGMRRSAWRTLSRGLGDLAADLDGLASLPWARRCEQIGELLVADLRARLGDEAHGDDDRPALVAALVTAATHAGSIAAIDEQIRAAEHAARVPSVEIATIHSVKGQEWPTCYVAGVRDGLLPHKRAETPEELEEERRLFYVAVTRARDTLIVSAGGAPSGFMRWIEGTGPGTGPGPRGGGEPVIEPDDGNGAKHDEELVAEQGADEGAARAADAALPAPVMAWRANMTAALAEQRERPAATPTAPVPAAPLPAAVVKALDGIREAIRARDEALTVNGEAYATAREIAYAEEGSDPTAGPRAVVVQLSAMRRLFLALGASEGAERGQVVFDLPGPRSCIVRVYSSIAVGADRAADVGEDSIRVVALYRHDGEAERPARPRDAYVARTIGWRRSLLARIEGALADLARLPVCPICGAPTRERKRKLDGGVFHGCVRYPACRGIAERREAAC